MANFKCYAVANGRMSGIYDTWEECRAMVQGFQGARYKGFDSRHDAEQWLMIWRAARREDKDGWTFIPASN